MTKKTNKYNVFDRINTVDILTAQTDSKYVNSPEILDEIDLKVQEILLNNTVPIQLKRFIYIQSISGARVSELLNIQHSDIISPTILRVKGLKHSEDRLIHIDKYCDYFSLCKSNMIRPFESLDRFYIYREYKKLNLVVSFIGSNKKAVTHSFRYRYIKKLKDNEVDISLIQREIGHKTQKTTERYEQKSKKISGN